MLGKPLHAQPAYCEALQTLRRVSSAARNLRNRTKTPVLGQFGVAPAIADYIDQFADDPAAPEITYYCDVQFKRLQRFLETTIYYVAQEAITNACVHSRSELVRVALVQEGDRVMLEVRDTGVGFDPGAVNERGLGLHGIRQRAELFGNDLQIESWPGRGARIRAGFPVIESDA
jgi:signal transduction histidine kinase